MSGFLMNVFYGNCTLPDLMKQIERLIMLQVYIAHKAAGPILLVLLTVSLLIFVYSAPPKGKPMAFYLLL